MSLKVMTFNEEQLEKKRVLDFEKEIQKKTSDYLKEEKILRTKEELTKEDQQTILNNRKEIIADEKELAERKETLGMTQGQDRQSGPLAETVGAAFMQFKSIGTELKQIGKDIGGTFMGVMKDLKGFGKGIMAVGASFKRLIISMLPAIIGFVTIGLPILAVVAGVIALVTAIGMAASALANLNPINWFKNKLKKSKETKESALKPKQLEQDLGDPLSEDFNTPPTSLYKDSQSSLQKILPNQPGMTGVEQTQPRFSFNSLSNNNRVNQRLSTNLNSETASLKANERTKNNIVIAPNQNSQTINQSGSTVLSMDSKNNDLTFLNLSNSLA
jgi:hypothetical protein